MGSPQHFVVPSVLSGFPQYLVVAAANKQQLQDPSGIEDRNLTTELGYLESQTANLTIPYYLLSYNRRRYLPGFLGPVSMGHAVLNYNPDNFPSQLVLNWSLMFPRVRSSVLE